MPEKPQLSSGGFRKTRRFISISTAVAEKISALETEDYMNRRASRASRKKFEKALSLVPDAEPEKQDTF